jgi:hypothetical protein
MCYKSATYRLNMEIPVLRARLRNSNFALSSHFNPASMSCTECLTMEQPNRSRLKAIKNKFKPLLGNRSASTTPDHASSSISPPQLATRLEANGPEDVVADQNCRINDRCAVDYSTAAPITTQYRQPTNIVDLHNHDGGDIARAATPTILPTYEVLPTTFVAPPTDQVGRARAVEPADLLHVKKAPTWNNALETLQNDYSEEWSQLKTIMVEAWNGLYETNTKKLSADKDSKERAQRIKRYLPWVTAAKPVVTNVAALDPHKVAPLVCTCVFFVIEVRIATLMIDVWNNYLDSSLLT